MDTGKRTFSLCIKWPFFSFTVKSGDSALEAEKAAHDASAAVAFAQGIAQLVGALFNDDFGKKQPNNKTTTGGRDNVNPSRRSASA